MECDNSACFQAIEAKVHILIADVIDTFGFIGIVFVRCRTRDLMTPLQSNYNIWTNVLWLFPIKCAFLKDDAQNGVQHSRTATISPFGHL